MRFPRICSRSHTQELSHHSLTLAVAQVFAVTLRPECKSARSTSRAHTFAYVRPYVLGERNTVLPLILTHHSDVGLSESSCTVVVSLCCLELLSLGALV